MKSLKQWREGQDNEYDNGERDGPAARLDNICMGLRGGLGQRLSPQDSAGLADELENIAQQIRKMGV